MTDQERPAGGLLERSAARLTLRYRPGTYAAEHIDELAARAERLARYIDKRLQPLLVPGLRFWQVTVDLEDATDMAPSVVRRPSSVVVVGTDQSGRAFEEQ